MLLEHHEYMVFRYGEVVVSNSPLPPNQTDQCKAEPEGSVVHLECGGVTTGSHISSVTFASYGTPSGYCNEDKGDTFSVNRTCHANSSQQVIEKECLGKPSCSVTASNAVFGGDPCHLTPKYLAADVVCTPAQELSAGAPDLDIALEAWIVRYPWIESDSSFSSSDPMLNHVWGLCKDTLRITSLDTTTDSNTRERLPYEADGAITGSSRYVFQNEYQWQRHSSIHK